MFYRLDLLLVSSMALGKPIKMDARTASGGHVERARICIRIDVSNPPPPFLHVRLGEKEHLFPISYEKLPSFCHSCLKLGHARQNCPLRAVAGREVHNAGKEKVAMIGESEAGWTVVQTKKAKQHMPRSKPPHLWKAVPAPPASCHALKSILCSPHPPLNVLPPLNQPSTSSVDPQPTTISDSGCQAFILVLERFLHKELNKIFNITAVYGKHSIIERQELWHSLSETCPSDEAWIILNASNLSKAGSDHNPLLLDCILETPRSPKGFKVLNVWFSNPSFLTTINHIWTSTGTCGGMRGFSNKLKELKSAIRKWNKESFGDIFQNLKKAEEEAITAELSYDSNPIESNREAWSQAMANLLMATKKETEYWKQKAQIRGMEKGDSNSKFFHSFVKGRRAKLTISQIKSRSGQTLKDAASIKAEAVDFFTQTFSHSSIIDPQEILKFIPQVISEEDNAFISRLPSMEEVKQAGWELDPHSTCGPDGFNGEFFRRTWHILGKDLLLAMQEFFLGIPPPTAYGATTLTLIPKIPNPQTFNDFRPISLSTFMSKILSKLLAIRLKSFLPKLISMEQGAFQKGKDIADQILITGELHHSLDRKVNGGNLIIKVDMAKAFDRLNSEYLQGVLSAFGFSPHVIRILFANLKSTHFSILINGEPTGFFKMERGIKQRDPLSPLLYILGAEGLSRTLNHHVNSSFITPFNADRCPRINHLAFADDLILFTNGHF
ncbi:unnamed protein product [Cuscuta campestris]|uniref:Reverse transcriptase domain-containing protein n=1 Tax=Cuscuta campestris TaxID=132261 RepID=A0A484MED6_9ASTE|nr:unnamed protein product [Cuscuta campestris]